MTTFATDALTSAWTQIAVGADFSEVLLQLRDGNAAHVYIGAEAPAEDENGYFTLRPAGFPGASFHPLETETIYARAATALPATLEGDRTAR